MVENLAADVLVIGGGMAGCQAALGASEAGANVILVDKATIARSGSSPFCHVALAGLQDDEYDNWFKEIAVDTDYLVDPGWVRIILEEEGTRIAQMADFGVPFERDGNGQLKLEQGRGQRYTSSVLFDGRLAMEKMKAVLLNKGVKLIERVMLTDLLTSDGSFPTNGRITGAVGFHCRTGQFLVIHAGAVVITTGATSAKLRCFYSDNVTGDGLGMAYRAGARLASMEFLPQPHFSIWNRRFNTGGQSQFQSHGAIMINARGERIIDKYQPAEKERMSDLSLLVQVIAREVRDGNGPIYFDMRNWEKGQVEKMRQVQPLVMRAFDKSNTDLLEKPVETTAMLCNWTGVGGIDIDYSGKSNLEGLYAAGNAAHLPFNISIAGINQAFCNVAGYRSGQAAAKMVSAAGIGLLRSEQCAELKRKIFAPLVNSGEVLPDDAYREINKTIVPYPFSVLKNEERIDQVLSKLESIESSMLPRLRARDIHDLVKANEVVNFILIAGLVYRCARERQESRNCHFREDYPSINHRWRKFIKICRREPGSDELTFVPINDIV